MVRHPDGRLDAPTRLVVGMNLVEPADGVVEPFGLREAEHGLDLRADVSLADALIEEGHEDDRRNLLDEDAVT